MSQPPSPKHFHSRYADGTPVYEEEEPNRLPLTASGDPIPDSAAEGFPHTRLRWDTVNMRIYQGRQFKENGIPEYDIDFTTVTNEEGKPHRPNVPVPHKQRFEQNIPGNARSGYKRSGEHEPLL